MSILVGDAVVSMYKCEASCGIRVAVVVSRLTFHGLLGEYWPPLCLRMGNASIKESRSLGDAYMLVMAFAVVELMKVKK